MSAAGFQRTAGFSHRRGRWGGSRATARRAGLELLIVSALATLSVLLGVILKDNTAATSTPSLASVSTSDFASTSRAVHDGAANPLASIGGRGDAARSDDMAATLGFMGVALTPRLEDRSGPGPPTADVARVIAEAIAAGAGSAGFGVQGSSVNSGGSGGFAILPALGIFLGRQLLRRLCAVYLCRVTCIFSRPLVRPG